MVLQIIFKDPCLVELSGDRDFFDFSVGLL